MLDSETYEIVRQLSGIVVRSAVRMQSAVCSTNFLIFQPLEDQVARSDTYAGLDTRRYRKL